MKLSADMVRRAFYSFPESDRAKVALNIWPQIPPIQTMAGYPFAAFEDDTVPPSEIRFYNAMGELLGRIVNIGT